MEYLSAIFKKWAGVQGQQVQVRREEREIDDSENDLVKLNNY